MIVAGFGFRKSATAASLQDALAKAKVARAVDATATLVEKAEALRPFGGLIIEVMLEDAQAQSTLTSSKASLAAWGVGSVAEATALAAAGPGARLLGPRVVSSDGLATCALAERVTS